MVHVGNKRQTNKDCGCRVLKIADYANQTLHLRIWETNQPKHSLCLQQFVETGTSRYKMEASDLIRAG